MIPLRFRLLAQGESNTVSRQRMTKITRGSVSTVMYLRGSCSNFLQLVQTMLNDRFFITLHFTFTVPLTAIARAPGSRAFSPTSVIRRRWFRIKAHLAAVMTMSKWTAVLVEVTQVSHQTVFRQAFTRPSSSDKRKVQHA